MTGKTRGAGRSRSWATMIYEESAPENWLALLEDLHIDAFVSPCHDSDVLPGGEPKKPHWHVLVSFSSVKSREQVKEVFDVIGGVGAEKIESFRNHARYLCHLDNPDKARYQESDVKAFGCLDYLEVIGVPSDKYEVIGEMIDFCDVNKIFSYAQLMRITRKYKPTWYRALCDNASWVMKEYLKAALWESQSPTVIADETKLVDPATGEILSDKKDDVE